MLCMSLPASVKSTRLLLKEPGDGLGPVIAKARRLLALEPLVQRLAGHTVKVAGLADGSLTLVTASAAQASRLRYEARGLVARLAAAKLPVQDLKVLVKPEVFAPPPAPPAPRRISPETAKLIADAAGRIADEPLRRALCRLAECGGKGQGMS